MDFFFHFIFNKKLLFEVCKIFESIYGVATYIHIHHCCMGQIRMSKLNFVLNNINHFDWRKLINIYFGKLIRSIYLTYLNAEIILYIYIYITKCFMFNCQLKKKNLTNKNIFLDRVFFVY